MDKFKIDSHKLMYHVERLSHWLEGKHIAPIYIEIATSGGCNQRCVYCALDFMQYKPVFLDTILLKRRLCEMALLGVKSVMYAGEGEPLLHKDIAGIIKHTKKSGIDVAITTNGVLLNPDLADSVLPSLSWIKVSINAATEKTYAKIHRSNRNDFKRVIKNLSCAVKIKKSRGYKCTLGMQLLLLPENSHEVVLLARKAKDMGVDYLVIKPYSQHYFSITTKYKNIKYNGYLKLADKLEKMNNQHFNVIFRIHTMRKWDKATRNYRHCYALPFWSYIDAQGQVWACSAYLGDKRFMYGNIYQNTFQEILSCSKRQGINSRAENEIDTRKCRINCRMDEINRYLWELKHPDRHVNFI